MKKIILTASWFAIAVYCILTGVYGPAGLKVTVLANDKAAVMLQNINFLEKLNVEYSLEWNALRSDAGLTAVQGRSLGFIASDEVVVRVALPMEDEPPVFIGERVLYDPASSLPESRIRAASLYIWLCVLLIGLARKLFSYGKHRGESRSKSRCERHHHVWQPQREIRVQEASRT